MEDDLSSITYRYELEWKDQVYTDVTYTLIDTAAVLVTMHCVNNTALPQNLSLNLIASIEYPEHYGTQVLKYGEGTKRYNAVNYRSLSYAVKKPNTDLVYDGWMRGEVRDARLIDGRGVGREFGRQPGDKVVYDMNIPPDFIKGRLLFIYTMNGGRESAMQLSGLTNQKVVFEPSDTLAVLESRLRLTGCGKA